MRAPAREKRTPRSGPHPCGNGSLFIPETFIGPSEHIGIQRANGTGKSTPVRHLMAMISHMPSDAPETLFVPQKPDDRQKRAAVAAIAFFQTPWKRSGTETALPRPKHGRAAYHEENPRRAFVAPREKGSL